MKSLPNVDITFRLRSMDITCIAEVMLSNCYRLPDQFDPTDEIYDIGANIGCFALSCHVRGAGKIYCYEPHPQNILYLRKNTHRIPSIQVHPVALWKASHRVATMADDEELSAMWFICEGGTVSVECLPLDSMIPNRPFRLLKIDAEGAEWPGIYESENIKYAKQILLELHIGRPVEGFDCTVEGMVKFLESKGFDVKTWGEDEAGLNTYVNALKREGPS